MIAAWTNHLWQSTLLALAAALLTLALRKNRAHVRYWLWFGASLKFLVPFSLLMGIGSHLVWAPAAQRIAVRVAPPAVSSRVIEISQPFTGTLPAAPAGSGVAWAPIAILAVWACGVACVLVIRLRGLLRIRAAMRASEPLREGRELETFRRLRGAGEKARQTGRSAPLCASGQWGRRPGLPSVTLVSSAARLEPGVFGILRPALWLPQGIGDRLSDAQLEAVLAHELCHVRRRDNLTAAIHMVAEALFWFHPMVWWIGARLIEERERACDEAVAQLGSDPKTYAESILKVCEFYAASPLACAAGVTGADLKKRIEGIMTNRFTRKLSLGKKALLAAAAALAVAGPIAIGVLSAPMMQAQAGQADSPQFAFEVASVKLSKPGGQRGMSSGPGEVRWTNTPLSQLIEMAFDVNDYSFAGPAWLDSLEVDIVAKFPSLDSRKQMPIMLRKLLVERFRLVFHRESKIVNGYALVVAKNGLKVRQTGGAGHGYWSFGADRFKATNCSMAEIADMLSRRLGQPIQNLTGVTGSFDAEVKWVPDPPPPDPSVSGQPIAAEPAGPSIFAALQEQAGLKLEGRKVPVEIVVVDSAERTPAAN